MLVFAATGLNGMSAASRLPASRALLRTFSRLTTPRMLTLEEAGEFGTTDYSMTFKDGDKVVSPWHDMPLELEGGLYNMLTEIPKMTLKKMEVHAHRALRHARPRTLTRAFTRVPRVPRLRACGVASRGHHVDG